MIGILYESDEWSDHKLARELRCALAAAGAGGDGEGTGASAPEAGANARKASASAGARTGEGAGTSTGACQVSDARADKAISSARVSCPADEVRLINMEDPASMRVALACDLLVSRVFASAVFRGHAASLERMPQLVAEAERRGIPLINAGRAHAFEVDKRLAAEALAASGIVVPDVFACALPDAIDVAALSYPCVIKPNCGGRTTHTAIARTTDEARAFLRAAPALVFIAEAYTGPERGYLTRIELVDGACALVVKRSIAPSGLSSYHEGSTYAAYDDCPHAVRETALQAGRALDIAFGSFDIIESAGRAYVIDANSVSNVSEDCTELLGIDLMREYAASIARRYEKMQKDRRKP